MWINSIYPPSNSHFICIIISSGHKPSNFVHVPQSASASITYGGVFSSAYTDGASPRFLNPHFSKNLLFLLAVCTITCLRAAFINNASTSTFPQPVPCNSCFTHSEHISETFSYSSIRPHPQNTFPSSILPILPRLQTLSSAPSR